MAGELQFYLIAVPAVIVLGLSKGGFTGLSALAMPMMSLVISPVRAAAIMLPVLDVQDPVSVWAFRRDFSPRNLLILIPSSMTSIAAGWLLAARVSEDAVRLAVGVIAIVFVFYMLIGDRFGRAPVETPGVPGGLPFQANVMPQERKPRVFAGAATMFFAVVNLIKLPPDFLLGQFSRENLAMSILLIPVAVPSTFAGVWLVRRVSADRFYAIFLALTFVIGVKLTYDAVLALACPR